MPKTGTLSFTFFYPKHIFFYPKHIMHKSIKILQLGKFLPGGGGIETVVYDLARGMAAQGCQCDVMVTARDRQPQQQTYCENSDILACHAIAEAASTMISPSMIARLRRICNDYDIVHVHHPNPMASLALYLSGYRGKVVVHWHSDIIRQRLALAFFSPLQRWMLKRADLIVGTSDAYIQGSPWLKPFRDKCRALPIGISRMPDDYAGAAQIRKAYPGKKIVFSLGRLVYYKGFRYLIDAAEHLADDYVVLIGGSGPLMKELQSQIDAKGLESRVRLLGRIHEDDLPAYYTACDVYCMSSCWKSEAFGVVLLEAMSLGKPIVATDIPDSGVPFVNAHNVTGLNVEVCNPEALAQAITAICDDEVTYARFSQNALARFEETFTLNSMISRCRAYYDQILEPQTSPEVYVMENAYSNAPRRLALKKVGKEHIMVEILNNCANMTKVYTLNDTAAWLWSAMEKHGRDINSLARIMCNDYEIEYESARRDIDTQIQQWHEMGLIAIE